MKVNELRDGMRKVDVDVTVKSKGNIRTVQSKMSGDEFRVCDVEVADETGTVTLTLWDADIEKVSEGDKVKVQNGYIKSFRNVLQLNVGKYGTLIVV